jgi:hypothetical protein
MLVSWVVSLDKVQASSNDENLARIGKHTLKEGLRKFGSYAPLPYCASHSLSKQPTLQDSPPIFYNSLFLCCQCHFPLLAIQLEHMI